ncbi:small GTP-binding protein [Nitrosomonas oligotropha]|uniref:non-specific serine/threonine protein kinase n=1 Tax=Nitrosomonas oligotropha TaxID=42354 RepID=A0A2T5HPS1_9PROT|nr:COR domain-containing protein [Nitrosomonas oligotropha]PTQ73563.1 small GTP-binding protein [Nitrosomonas oligotropha]
MLNQEEIERRLSKTNPKVAAAFAVRAAMRVLPILASRERISPFWFWDEDMEKRLFAVMQSERVAFLQCISTDRIGGVARAAAAAATATATAPAYAAASNRNYQTELQEILLQELDLITHKSAAGFLMKRKIVNASEFLQKPLWLGETPKNWQEDWQFFKQSVLSFDDGFSSFLDWFDDRIAGKPIDVELLEKQVLIPEEILSQDVASINAYLNSLTQANKALNRVRAIFMGHGTAGKTSLIRCLWHEKVVEGKEDMTTGINIREWPVPESPVKVMLWDFGGQVIAHATHQFFLRSGCLYVLVMDARAEINATEQAQYWLEHVKAYAGSAPVMLVGNKVDLVRINLDLAALKDRYPNIVGFYPLSCTQYETGYKSEFDSFQRDFIQCLKLLDLHQVQFLDEHFQAMDALRAESRQQAFLTQDDFNRFCAQAGVKEEGSLNRAWLLDTLDKLGVIIHFPDLPFHDAFVLNPRWLTYGVYTLLYSQEAKENKGHLNKKQVITILQREAIQDEQGFRLTYPAEKCGFIIDAMRSFKLCYDLKNDSDTLVIPDLLSAERPPLDFDKSLAGIVFEFRFPHLLPRHVIPMFIVCRHAEIDANQVWQTGVVLKNETHLARALVTANYSDRVIILQVQGKGARDYLHILHDEIKQIVQKLRDLSCEEWVELPQSAIILEREFGGLLRGFFQEKADYRQLLGTLRANQKVYISSSGVQYDLFKVLGEIMTIDKLEKETSGGFTINGNNNVVKIENAVVGSNHVNFQQVGRALDDDLRKFIQQIKIEIDDNADKAKALRELELLREHVAIVDSGNEAEKRDAKSGLKEFADKIKNGIGYTAQVTKDISTVSEKLPGLIEKIGSFIEVLPF